MIVAELVPLAPEVIVSQLLAGVSTAVHGIVAVPVMERLNVVEPASFGTSRLDGVTDSTGGAACVTVTSTGLLVAVAVTRTVAVRDEVLVVLGIAVKLQVMVPELVPLSPDVIVSQLPDITDAFHVMVPVPVLETLNVVVPASAETSRMDGVTNSTG